MKTASLFRSAARSMITRSNGIRPTTCVAARSFHMLPTAMTSTAKSTKAFITSSPSFFTSSTRKISSSIITHAESCSCAEAFQKLSAGTHQYLDVRSQGEFESGHAEGAVNVPVFFMGTGGMTPNPDFVSQVEATFPAKDADLLVACAAGKRSAVAVDMLQKAGYSALVDVQGGFQTWMSEGLPVKK